MGDNPFRYTMRIDREVFQKFRYVAGYDGRSANKELERCLRKYISSFEHKYGEIPLDEEKESLE